MNNTENNTNNTVQTNTVPNTNNNVNPNVGVQPTEVGVATTSSTVTSNQTSNLTNSSNVVTPVVSNVETNQNIATPVDGDNVIANEKLKNVEINYTPPSKAKTFFTFLMFALIIGFVIFLPEITEAVNQYKANKNALDDSVITTGRLECDLTSNTANLDITYSRVFKFTNSELDEAEFKVTTRGDATLDEQTLNDMSSKCNLLKEHTGSIVGVDINCDYSEGKLVETQRFKYASINLEDLNAAFTEAGGIYPEFENKQNIDNIEKNMNASGYSCIRKK